MSGSAVGDAVTSPELEWVEGGHEGVRCTRGCKGQPGIISACLISRRPAMQETSALL